MLHEERWNALLLRLCGQPPAPALFVQLCAAYAEPQRHYHTAEHIMQLLREFDKLHTAAHRPDEVELAIWLHDIVYNPQATDNEARSAALACDWLRSTGADAALCTAISELILATCHTETPTTADAQLLVDLDLSILGQPSAVYARYAEAIRKEYAWVAPAVYATGRARILRGFLARPRLYSSDHFEVLYAKQMRDNLRWELCEL